MTGVHKPVLWPRLVTVGTIIALGGTAGCEAGREFRTAAGPAVQNGVTEIVTGLLDGIFAAIEPEGNTNSRS